MKVSHHIIASTITATAVYGFSRSVTMSAVTLVAGIFIDGDHALDYLILKRPPYSPKGLLETFYEGKLERLFLILHSWELLTIIAIASMATHWHPIIAGLLIGMGHHLLLDQIYNRPHPLGYFLTFRIYKGFSYTQCFPHGGIETHKPSTNQ